MKGRLHGEITGSNSASRCVLVSLKRRGPVVLVVSIMLSWPIFDGGTE